MIRELIIPENQNIQISLPASYIGKFIEILAVEVQENEILEKPSVKSVTNFYEQV